MPLHHHHDAHASASKKQTSLRGFSFWALGPRLFLRSRSFSCSLSFLSFLAWLMFMPSNCFRSTCSGDGALINEPFLLLVIGPVHAHILLQLGQLHLGQVGVSLICMIRILHNSWVMLQNGMVQLQVLQPAAAASCQAKTVYGRRHRTCMLDRR